MTENQYELEAGNVRLRINAVLKEKGLTENSVAAGDSATQSRLNSQLSHGKRITLDTVPRILAACPDVSGDSPYDASKYFMFTPSYSVKDFIVGKFEVKKENRYLTTASVSIVGSKIGVSTAKGVVAPLRGRATVYYNLVYLSHLNIRFGVLARRTSYVCSGTSVTPDLLCLSLWSVPVPRRLAYAPVPFAAQTFPPFLAAAFAGTPPFGAVR